MKRRLLIYIIFGILILGSLGVIFRGQIQDALFPPSKEIHIHAGFQVYENGKQKSFEDISYMNDKPCGSHAPGEHVDEQLEKAHLHEMIGDVVHVHREGATWQDLFTNLKYPIDKDKITETYVNGVKTDGILSKEVQPYESVTIFIGKPEGDIQQYLDKQVKKDHIIKTEKRSELCGATPAK